MAEAMVVDMQVEPKTVKRSRPQFSNQESPACDLRNARNPSRVEAPDG